MPAYPWLLTKPLNFDDIPARMNAMRMLGVPYSQTHIGSGVEQAKTQAAQIAAKIEQEKGPGGLADKQVVALIAYVDRLGKDLFKTPRGGTGGCGGAQSSPGPRPGRASIAESACSPAM